MFILVQNFLAVLTLSGLGFFDQPHPEGDESSPLSKIWSAWARVMKRGMDIA